MYSCIHAFKEVLIHYRYVRLFRNDLQQHKKVRLCLFSLWRTDDSSQHISVLFHWYAFISSFYCLFMTSHCLFIEVWPSSFVNGDMILSSSGQCVFPLLIVSLKHWPAAAWEEICKDFVYFVWACWKASRWRVQHVLVFISKAAYTFHPQVEHKSKRCARARAESLIRLTGIKL